MKHLRHALEEDSNKEDGEKTIVMQGPLSQVYTDALAVAYAKKDPVTGTFGMESQAMDMANLAKLASMVVAPETVPEPDTLVYGVSPVDLTPEEVVNITGKMAESVDGDPYDDNRFVLIIDGTSQDGSAGDVGSSVQARYVDLSAGLESIASGFGIKVYHSLTEYAKTL